MTDKPQVLYHASPSNNIEVFEPRSGKRPKNFGHDPVIFATDDFTFATHFLVDTDSSWTADGAFNRIDFYVCSDRERFLTNDKGGTIYTFPADTFTQLKRREWFSKVAIKPISKSYFPSGLQAMLDHGVQFYFTDKDTFQKIRTSSDHGLEVIKTLRSENQTRNINVIPFP